MSFILKKVELKNIRSHKEFIFEPALTGITAVSGGNGKGKSTIFNALAWALYGTKINSSTKNSDLIREGVSLKTDTCYVKVYFSLGGKTYLVHKAILTDKGGCECNVYVVGENNEETCLAGPSVSHTQKFIRQLLQMDEKSFLISMFVQQKQVDNIMATTGKERANIIEKLTGISSITEAIKIINDEQRDLSKSISLFQIEDLESLKAQGTELSSSTKQLKAEYTALKKEISELDTALKAKEKEFSKDNTKQEKRKQLEESINLNKEKINWLEEQTKESTEFLVEFKKTYKTVNQENSATINKTYQEILKSQAEITVKLSSTIKGKDELKKCLAQGSPKEDIDVIENKIKEISLGIQKLENETHLNIPLKVKENENKIQEELERQSHFKGEAHKNCPLCSQSIENPKEIINRSKSIVEKLSKENQELEQKKNSFIEKLNSSKGALAVLQKDLEYGKSYSENVKKLSTLENDEAELNKELLSLKGKISSTELLLKQAQEAEGLVNKANTAKKTLLENANKIDTLKKSITTHEKEVEKLECLSFRENQKLGTEVKELTDTLHKKMVKFTEMSGTLSINTERLKVIKEKYSHAKEQHTKYKDISQKISNLATSQALMSEFKKDRIQKSMPTLEFYASDLLNKFTGGDFTQMNIDNKFNITVTTADGKERAISALSGGELSATAIALRIGISMLLSSSETTLLVMDEALTAMDEVRARQIMETIASTTNSQIIFIAHNGDINSIADKTVEI